MDLEIRNMECGMQFEINSDFDLRHCHLNIKAQSAQKAFWCLSLIHLIELILFRVTECDNPQRFLTNEQQGTLGVIYLFIFNVPSLFFAIVAGTLQQPVLHWK